MSFFNITHEGVQGNEPGILFLFEVDIPIKNIGQFSVFEKIFIIWAT